MRGKITSMKGLGTATLDLQEISKHKCETCRRNRARLIMNGKYLCKRCAG